MSFARDALSMLKELGMCVFIAIFMGTFVSVVLNVTLKQYWFDENDCRYAYTSKGKERVEYFYALGTISSRVIWEPDTLTFQCRDSLLREVR